MLTLAFQVRYELFLGSFIYKHGTKFKEKLERKIEIAQLMGQQEDESSWWGQDQD